MRDYFDLTGKVAIITGGHSWLGYDMACVLAEYGCSIIIASRTEEKIKNATDNIKKQYGVETKYIVFDQTSSDECQRMAEEAESWKNHIDILINNAGGGSGISECDFLNRSQKDITAVITSNLIGSLLCTQAVGRYMVKRRYGKIINIGSIAGIVGRDRRIYTKNNKMQQPVDYAAAKAGVIGMTRDLAAYFAPYNVHVNSISPGGFYKNEPKGFVDDYSNLTPQNRMGKMGKDIKGAALFLASDASDYVTGHNLVVDGGFSTTK